MHNIEPFFLWRDLYKSEHDPNALNYKNQYSEFHYTNKVYNYVLHPQWDNFGSDTLLYKLIYADYEDQFCIIELIGEWNDAINNDMRQWHTLRVTRNTRIAIAPFHFVLIEDESLEKCGSGNG